MARAKTENRPKIKISRKELKRQRFLIIVSFFIFVYGIIFYYWPLTGWLMAFENYKPKKGLLGSKFVGMDKFKFLFEDDVFIKSSAIIADYTHIEPHAYIGLHAVVAGGVTIGEQSFVGISAVVLDETKIGRMCI